jgi:hypothetical protein
MMVGCELWLLEGLAIESREESKIQVGKEILWALSNIAAGPPFLIAKVI